ncbi:hypothetical protein U1Q18_037847 [Sarracenia purpurea var. burkii]
MDSPTLELEKPPANKNSMETKAASSKITLNQAHLGSIELHVVYILGPMVLSSRTRIPSKHQKRANMLNPEITNAQSIALGSALHWKGSFVWDLLPPKLRVTPPVKEVSEGLLPRFESSIRETNIETFEQGSCPVYKEPMKADIVVNQPDSEDELHEVFDAATGTVADEFDSPVVRISPVKSSLKSPPNKKASSSKQKKKRSNSKSFYA